MNLRQLLDKATQLNRFMRIYTLEDFWCEQGIWSEKTFGKSGPERELKHLKKEVEECLENPGDLEEYADLLFLVFGACRSAGFSLRELIAAASAKLVINQHRKWGPLIPGEPCEHIEE